MREQSLRAWLPTSAQLQGFGLPCLGLTTGSGG